MKKNVLISTRYTTNKRLNVEVTWNERSWGLGSRIRIDVIFRYPFYPFIDLTYSNKHTKELGPGKTKNHYT